MIKITWFTNVIFITLRMVYKSQYVRLRLDKFYPLRYTYDMNIDEVRGFISARLIELRCKDLDLYGEGLHDAFDYINFLFDTPASEVVKMSVESATL